MFQQSVVNHIYSYRRKIYIFVITNTLTMKTHYLKTAAVALLFLLSGKIMMAQSFKNDSTFAQDKQREMIAYDPAYLQHKAVWLTRTTAIGVQLYKKEALNEHIECEHQLFNELIWLYIFTADAKRIDTQLSELEAMLRSPVQANSTIKNNIAQDCSKAWFMKIADHYDELKTKMDYAFLLDSINSPEKLTAYFKPLTVSDIAHTGIDHDRELLESLSNLMRLILRGQPEGYHYHPELKATLMKLILNDF